MSHHYKTLTPSSPYVHISTMMMSDTLFSPSPEFWTHHTAGEEPPATPSGPDPAGDLTSPQSLSQKSCLSKTVRRRSKSSRKAPTTLLNADTSNFRALVQKFTGCPTNTFSFGAQKGPLNLSFGGQHDNYNYYAHDHEANYSKSSSHKIYRQSDTITTQKQQQQHDNYSYYTRECETDYYKSSLHEIHRQSDTITTQKQQHQPQQDYNSLSSSNRFGSDDGGGNIYSCFLLDQLLGSDHDMIMEKKLDYL